MSRRDIKAFKESIAEIQRNKIINKDRRDGYTAGIYLVFWVLYNKYGWGNIKLKGLLHDTLDNLDSINKGYLSPNDIIATMRDEVGLVIEGARIMKVERDNKE